MFTSVAPTAAPSTAPKTLIAYLRVSTLEQADSGLGLDAQERALRAAAELHGVTLRFAVETASGASTKRRPVLASVLEELANGEADGLVVAKTDRLSRSTVDYLTMLDKADREGWQLVSLDAPVDPATPMGRMVLTMSAAFGELERQLIATRTREALAEKKAQGVRLGRPASRRAPKLAARAARRREEGLTLQAIADELNREGVKTLRGGAEWRPSTISKLVKAHELNTAAAAARSSS
jgi:DNA invertase Pin-like site-specific DNA recombinase